MLLDLTSATNQRQGDLLFYAPAAKRDHSKLMEAMDKINERYTSPALGARRRTKTGGG